jgi:agmatinase
MQDILRGLGGLTCVGFDVVEVLPQYDGPGQITSLLAANLCWEFLALTALRKKRS